MKLVRHGAAGQEKPGIMDPQGRVRDLSEHIADVNGAAIGATSLEALRRLDLSVLPLVPQATRLGSCIADVGNFIAVGLNYADHAAESGMAVPEEPVLFNKAPSCIVGPDDDVRIPPGSLKTDWEVELAIVIG